MSKPKVAQAELPKEVVVDAINALELLATTLESLEHRESDFYIKISKDMENEIGRGLFGEHGFIAGSPRRDDEWNVIDFAKQRLVEAVREVTDKLLEVAYPKSRPARDN